MDLPGAVMHLDHLFWNPGWIESSSPEFQAKVSATLTEDAYKHGWVTDGNYHRRLTDELDGATDIICGSSSSSIIIHQTLYFDFVLSYTGLDTPFLFYFPRLIKRTFLRLFHRREPCAPGCDERASETFFSRKSILWWAITNHLPFQRREAARFQRSSVDLDIPRHMHGHGIVAQRLRASKDEYEYIFSN